MATSNYGAEPENEGLLFDLRQYYAIEVVGPHLKDIADSRKQDKYNSYFKSLKDLFIVTQHKFKDINFDYIDEEGKKISINGREMFKRLMGRASKVARENPAEWNGLSNDPIKKAKIEEVLNNAEMFLYEALNEGGIFGINYEDIGL